MESDCSSRPSTLLSPAHITANGGFGGGTGGGTLFFFRRGFIGLRFSAVAFKSTPEPIKAPIPKARDLGASSLIWQAGGGARLGRGEGARRGRGAVGLGTVAPAAGGGGAADA